MDKSRMAFKTADISEEQLAQKAQQHEAIYHRSK